MRKRFKFLLASSSIGGLYILFEYYIHKRRTKQIKEQKERKALLYRNNLVNMILVVIIHLLKFQA